MCLCRDFIPDSSVIHSTESEYGWSNSWGLCGSVVFVHSLDFMTFVFASVMFLWIGFSHVYTEPHLHSLRNRCPNNYNRHNTVNTGTLGLLTEVADFFYYD